MRKYIFLMIFIFSNSSYSEDLAGPETLNDFEAELKMLENKELSVSTNSSHSINPINNEKESAEQAVILDTVNENKAAPFRDHKNNSEKKTRRVPSR